MYMVTSLWKFGSAGQAREAVARFREGLAPLLGRQAGLRHWHLAVTGADEAITMAIWESRAAYEAAQPNLAAWGQQNLSDLDARVQFRRRGDVAARAGQ